MSGTRVQLDHVAIGVPQVRAVAPVVVGALGGQPRGAGRNRGFCFWQWEFEGGGALEVLEPDGPPGGFLERFLARRGAGVHHVTFKVPDIRESLDHAKARGFGVVGFDDSSPAWIEAFLHPKSAPGIVVQIVESHPELYADFEGPSLAFPPAPAPAAPARLLGLALRVRDAARARDLFEGLLDGAGRERDGRSVFEWPESPLRIAVTPDAAGEEGPLALEWSAPHALALPRGRHPVLGIELVQREEPR
jgi:catechol 2,3-dioxygenase-like lactoylglutathione lyase family enzyme